MLKKVFAILLAMLTLLTILPLYASADVGDYEYDETEPNDYLEDASWLENDSTVYGEVSYRDVDTFGIYLEYESRVQIICAADYGVLRLSIFEGEDLIVLGDEGYTPDGTPYDIIDVTLPAGIYYVILWNSEEDWYNNNYGFYYKYSVSEDVHIHNYSEEIIAPNCIEQGYTIFTCDCGDYYVDNYVDPTHTYDDDYDLTCNLCGYEREFTDGWKTLNGERVYYKNGVMVTNAWVQDDIGWSYLDANGYCVKNKWMQDSAGWCYLGEDGYMLTNQWVKDSGGWCYVGANGYCVKSKWVKDSVGWCYLNASGRMATNQWIKDTVGWCYVGANGYCVTNKWMKDSKGWCYLDANGRMATNKWIQDTVGWCYVGANGYCVTNKWMKDSKGWVYLNSSGRMATNQWIKDSNGWCYVGTDGYMVTDYWVKDSSGWNYIGSNGYITSHELDYHNHSFSAPTYTNPATCSCGATNGEPLELIVYLDGEAPFYTKYHGRSKTKLTNFYYSTDTYRDNLRLYIYFDAEKTWDENGSNGDTPCGATIKVFDENGYLVDSATWFKSGVYNGQKFRSECVRLELDNWSGRGSLTVVVEDY